MLFKSLAIAAVVVAVMPVAALAQSFPQDDEFTSYGSWEDYVSVEGGEVRTDSEGGWSGLRVSYEDGINFTYSFGSYDGQTEDTFKSLFDTELSNQVVLVVDGRQFPASTATMWAADGGIGIGFNFANEAADCSAVAALSNARLIQVRFPDRGYGEALPMSGKGSSAALTGVCA